MELLNLLVRVTARDDASETIDEVSGNLVGNLANAAKTAAKALAGMWAVKKAYDFGRAAFAAYTQFEQLEGGVAKLYGNANMGLKEYAESVGKTVDEVSADYKRNEEAQKLVMENAQQAWKTAGMDANTYMQTATGFSAALINSLGGDTKEAARLTDEAMIAMSDNVNTFGSDMASVQYAFQGFAKQNYTMLDNLKLGYGGTKTEMQRLIKDAAAMKQEQEDLNMTVDAGSMSFDNIVKAIQVVQKHQGIYGTTTKEALHTIEGSMNATKAAWQNLIAEIGKPDADLPARVGNLFDAVFGVVDEKTKKREGGLARNVMTEVETIATNVTTGVSNLFGTGVDFIRENAPSLVETAMQEVGDAIERAWNGLLDFRTSFSLTDAIFGEGGAVDTAGKVGEWFSNLGKTVEENWPYIQGQLETLWEEIVATAETFGPQIADAAWNLLPEGAQEKIGVVKDKFDELITKGQELWDGISPHLQNVADKISEMADTGKDKLQGLADKFANMDAQEFSDAIDNISAKFQEWLPFLTAVVTGIVTFNASMAITAGLTAVQGIISGIAGAFAAFNAVLAANPIVAVVTGLSMLAAMLITAYHTNEDFRNHVNDAWAKVKEFVGEAAGAIGGFVDGVNEAFNTVKEKADEVWKGVQEVLQGFADFLDDPIGTIQDKMGELVGAYDATAKGAETNMTRVESSIDKAMENSSKSIGKYNNVGLNSKRASATVNGNAVNGTAKDAVSKTDATVAKMGSKEVSARVNGNAVDGTAKSGIDKTRDSMSKLSSRTVSAEVTGNVINGGAKKMLQATIDKMNSMQSKEVTVTTHQRTIKTTETRGGTGGAWGGISYHATGGVRVADRYGAGVPLDVVGERGPEAIVPLTSRYGKDFARMMGQWAGEYISSNQGPSTNIYMEYNANEDATQLVTDIAQAVSLVL